MSEEEVKKIKEDLKKEILNELTRKEYVKDNTWRTVKKEFEKMFYSKGYTDTYQLAQIFSGIQAIIRNSMGYRSVEIIPAEQYEETKKRMFILLNMFPDINKK